jgi:hypothetical protein
MTRAVSKSLTVPETDVTPRVNAQRLQGECGLRRLASRMARAARGVGRCERLDRRMPSLSQARSAWHTLGRPRATSPALRSARWRPMRCRQCAALDQDPHASVRRRAQQPTQECVFMSLAHRPVLRRAALLASLALLGACTAPTVLNTQWANPQFAGKPPMRSILVLGIAKDPTNRRSFEDQMVKQLTARGVKAMPSYQFAPEAGAAEQVKLERAVKESGAAGVLLSRVVNISEEVKVSPGMYMGPPMGYGFGGFYGYYGGMWASSYYTPPTVYTQQNVAADTRLFEAKDFALVWSASTTTTPMGGNVTSLFEQFAKLIVDALAKDGFV